MDFERSSEKAESDIRLLNNTITSLREENRRYSVDMVQLTAQANASNIKVRYIHKNIYCTYYYLIINKYQYVVDHNDAARCMYGRRST